MPSSGWSRDGGAFNGTNAGGRWTPSWFTLVLIIGAVVALWLLGIIKLIMLT